MYAIISLYIEIDYFVNIRYKMYFIKLYLIILSVSFLYANDLVRMSLLNYKCLVGLWEF